MTLFADIETHFLFAKEKMERKDSGWWKPVIGHIQSVQELIDTLSKYTIRLCIGRHANGDFGTNPPRLGGASFDARCIDSVENAACAHNTRLRHLLDLGWNTLEMGEEERERRFDFVPYNLLEQSIHRYWGEHLRNFHQREYGRGVMVEILEVKTALEIALKFKRS